MAELSTEHNLIPDTQAEDIPLPSAETEGISLEDMLAMRLAYEDPAPADCTDAELAAAQLGRHDVLVGTVRSDEQFSFTIDRLCYYAPARLIAAEDLPVEFVALYEEGLTRLAGIKRYGEVTETRVCRRADIPVPMRRDNGKEAYYLFTVKAWQYLEHPIVIKDSTRGRPVLTSRFLLEHCRQSYQLFNIHSPAEYRLMQVLCRARADIENNRHEVFYRVGETHMLSIAGGCFHLINAHGSMLCQCPLRLFDITPGEVLRQMVYHMNYQ